ncbi:MAG: glycosyltransferase [Bacteroides sp.]|nr:glycosyltransferase [Bacteroides sp.]
MSIQKKILHVINGMGTGGAEKDIMNWYRNIDRNKIQFDFLIRSDEMFYKEEIEKMGGTLYKAAPFPFHIIKNYTETKKFMKQHASEYDVIHMHGNALVYILPLIFAKKYKIPIRIMHIHNTKANGFLATFLHHINKKMIGNYTTVKLACSQPAGMFAFGKKRFHVINNAMDLERISNSHDVCRVDLNISETSFVIGHVGRFLPVKNQKFVIDVYKKIYESCKNSVLVLVGDGPMRKELQDYVCEKKISDKVKFLGERNDVESILKLVDCVVFPSLYEGIPLVVLESQACKKNVICSNNVDKRVRITPYVKFLSLNLGAERWADEVISSKNKKVTCDILDAFKKARYDIESIVLELYKFYGIKT